LLKILRRKLFELSFKIIAARAFLKSPVTFIDNRQPRMVTAQAVSLQNFAFKFPCNFFRAFRVLSK
jgi:hypothetical protein